MGFLVFTIFQQLRIKYKTAIAMQIPTFAVVVAVQDIKLTQVGK